MDTAGLRRRWQFSLRNFLLAVLIVGPIVGVVGPIIRDATTEWKPPSRQVPSRVITPAVAPSDESASYYETGETPLY